MNPKRVRESLVALLCLAPIGIGAGACALANKAEPVSIRYFNPELIPTTKPRLGTAAGAGLRLGRISSGSGLRERIAYRAHHYETGYYDNLRWTERPETYLRRALTRTLFEAHGLQGVLSGDSPTLDVELLAFEEIRRAAQCVGHIRLRFTLYQERRVLLERTLDFERVAQGNGFERVVAALAEALNAGAETVATEIEGILSSASAQTSH